MNLGSLLALLVLIFAVLGAVGVLVTINIYWFIAALAVAVILSNGLLGSWGIHHK